ncbi:uncharacterized protein LOC117174505 isoform X2 [Belonocnema kinseyi]|uniref:uncharacterized protein LOC117174505 isoform X2 n=1 Tax=Belonocnema kinseyi TaxID=2817044 RepID=UPI00143DBF4E|nr:uncharacterized protein LOC117174505 isoform X2 [Belonocnema kinseyi]
MSQYMKSLQFGYLSNKEKEDFFLSDDEEDDFNFKYIPSSQFKHIVKDVKRQKIKTDEENAWASFVQQQDAEKLYHRLKEIDPKLQNVNRRGFESVEEVDRELQRLEEDALPEINKRTNKGEYEIRDRLIDDKILKKIPLMKDSGTGSTNFLLTIPEEDFLSSSFDRTAEAKPRGKNNSRKSSSARAFRPRKDDSKQLTRAMNDLDYSSSPELSPDRLTDREEIMYVRPDPVIAAKIVGTQKKISEVLDEIAHRLGRIPLPDGDRDLYRRQQRVMEFSIRFARNYLYDLGRQVADIRRHVNAISPSFRKKLGRRGVVFHIQAIEQKLSTAHQLLLHALSAYCKHIPSSVLKGHPGKLREILQVVIDLKDFCEKIHLAPDYVGSGDMEGLPLGKDTDNRCSAILSKLRLTSDNESQILTHTTRSTLATAANTMRSKRRSIRKQVTNRLSMYNVNMDTRLPKSQPNRKTSLSQKEKKRNSISNLKPIYNNRPQTPEFLHPSPVTHKSSKEVIRNGVTKISIPPKEDDIKTMMEIIVSTDSDAGSSIETHRRFENLCLDQQSKVQRLSARSHNFQNSEKCSKFTSLPNEKELTKKVTQITEEHLSNLVPVIADLMSLIGRNPNDSENRSFSSVPMETLLEIIQKHQKNNNSKGNLRKSDECQSPTLGNVNGMRTGSKNMQLICLRSADDKKEEPRFIDASCQANEDQRHKSFIKDGLIELRFSEDLEMHLLEYRHEYRSSSKSSPMYSSKSQNEPWDVVAWIADKLVNELIVDLSNELQMDDVINKLFELEFQEF